MNMLTKVLKLTGVFSVVSFARIGYVAKGLIFLAVGALALLAVMGFAEGRVTGTDGAIHIIGSWGPGRIGFGLLAFGLAAHVFWRFYQTIMDPDEKGRSVMGLLQRGGLMVSGIFYASLSLAALSAVTGISSNGDAAMAFGESLVGHIPGRILLGLVGVIGAGVGVYQLVRAWRQSYRDRWIQSAWLKPFHGIMAWLSSYGIAVRACLFLLLGWQLIKAGWFASSDQIMDVATAMWRVTTETYGRELLGILATGLIVYGIYCLFNAAFRDVKVTPG